MTAPTGTGECWRGLRVAAAGRCAPQSPDRAACGLVWSPWAGLPLLPPGTSAAARFNGSGRAWRTLLPLTDKVTPRRSHPVPSPLSWYLRVGPPIRILPTGHCRMTPEAPELSTHPETARQKVWSKADLLMITCSAGATMVRIDRSLSMICGTTNTRAGSAPCRRKLVGKTLVEVYGAQDAPVSCRL